MRFLSFLFAAGLCAIPLAAHADDATTLLAKHKAFVGWQAGDASVPGWSASGARTSGRATDALTESRTGIIYRDTLSVAGGRIKEDSGFTGNLFWQSDPNGFTVTQLGAPAQIAYDVNLIRSEGVAAIPNSTLNGSAQVNGMSADVIRVQPAAGLPMDLYEDPSTGAFVQAVIDPQGAAKTLVTIDGYSAIGSGMKAVSSWSVGSVRYALSSIALKQATLAELQPPSPRATWSYGGDTIPVDLVDLANHLYQPQVTLSLNGVSGTFAIDTGTPGILVFDTFARKAGLDPIDGADFSPYSGNPRYLGYGLARTLAIGKSTLSNVLVERISARNSRIAGLIGYDFFANTIAEVDLSTNTMQLYDPTRMQPSVTPGAYSFSIDLTSRTPVIPLHLSGNAYGFPHFATGEPFFMMLAQTLRDNGSIAAADVSVSYTVPSTVGSSIGGDPLGSSSNGSSGGNMRGFQQTATARGVMRSTYSDYSGAFGSATCVLLHETVIGPYRYESPPLCFVSNVFGTSGGEIGMDFLKHFDWTIDYPDQKFLLTPNNK